MKRIVILGTLDTKGEQLCYLKKSIESRGHKAVLLDLSTGTAPSLEADITSTEIAQIAGKRIEDLRRGGDRFEATETMTVGAQRKVAELLSQGGVDGIVALGGTTMGLIAARVMQVLPFGIPKVITVPAAQPAFVRELFDAMDVVVMQVIMEFARMHDLLRHVIEQTAGAICGMAELGGSHVSLRLPYPSVAITELGFSFRCARQVEMLLEEKGYNVCSFHAQGISDKAMDRLIAQGFFDGIIDIVPAGLIEEILKGNRAAGKERLDAAAERGIPMVLAPCCLNLTGCGPTRHDQEKYNSRSKIYRIDAMRSMTRLNEEELRLCAALYAEKLNKAKGPVRFLIPLRGWSSIDREGTAIYDPGEDRIFVEELMKHLKEQVEVIEVDCNLEEPEFAQALVENFAEIFQESRRGGMKAAN